MAALGGAYRETLRDAFPLTLRPRIGPGRGLSDELRFRRTGGDETGPRPVTENALAADGVSIGAATHVLMDEFRYTGR